VPGRSARTLTGCAANGRAGAPDDVATAGHVRTDALNGPKMAVFESLWIMPLLMAVAGAGSWFALASKGAVAYIRERAARLLVPLYGLGLFVPVPPRYYWDQVTKGPWSGSLFEFYPVFFGTVEFRLGPHFLDFWSGHLWFLRFLFLYSLLSLPLLLFLKSRRGRPMTDRLAGWCRRRGVIVLLAGGYRGWQVADYAPARVAFVSLAALTGWSWIVFFLGQASRHAGGGSRLLSYANEAVLPFYVLHQTVILAIGRYAVQWDAGIGLKYVVITAASFVLIMVPYEFLIRRVNALRFLFGMRLRRSAAAPEGRLR